MSNFDQLKDEIEALRQRLSKLSEASLRVSESLDVRTVLHKVVNSARALTGARYGAITTVGDSGQVRDFVTSGLTEEKHKRIASWPDGPRLFEHFRILPGALRLRDVSVYIESLGFTWDLIPPTPFLGMPMRHRGVHVGNFFLAGKEGGPDFSAEDEETMVLFASQAASAIANAHTHRKERQARARLEALVETTPVGVLVFDANTGQPLSLNREVKRIFESLRTPGEPLEHLLKVATCRRADGSEISLEEFPLAQHLSGTTTLRGEEIVVEAPDGRSVTTLVNVTPILAANEAVESVVITMQDLAPLEELERSRAEFLGMVSHELRAPLASIKGSAVTVLNSPSALDPAEVLQFFRIIDEQTDHMRSLIGDLLDMGRIEAGMLSVTPEPADLAELVEQARKTFLTGGSRHSILVDLPPNLTRVMADRHRIVQVLNNLFANASRYSPESAPIRVGAVRDGQHVAVTVSDEGRGLSRQRLAQLFRKHSRALGDQDVSARNSGLGLAICRGLVEAHGGRIRAESGGPGLGTQLTFTLALADASNADGASGSAQDAGRSPRAGGGRTQILIVDDDPRTLKYLRDILSASSYSSVVTGNPQEVSRLIARHKPDLVLLDLMLPGTDGIQLMERVPSLARLPVIFISGYGRDETIARALQAGAADYVVKPFSATELVARMEAALRKQAKPREPYVLGDLVVNYDVRHVTVAGQHVELTATEYELIRSMSLNAGRVSTYESLLRQVWGVRTTDDNRLRLVRTFIKKLRSKLGDSATSPSYIFTERKVGYRMAEADQR